jgi:hypothetical protein
VPLPHPFRAPIIQAQNILLQKLGIAVNNNNNADDVDAEAVEKLLATFAAPLSP